MVINFFFKLLMNHKRNIEEEDLARDQKRLEKLKDKMNNDEKMKKACAKLKQKRKERNN